MSEKNPLVYQKIFELGLVNEDNPACKVFQESEVCPVVLAGLVTAMFETVMRYVPDSQQIEFEETFQKALKVLLEERFNFDLSIKDYEE
jgi:hypothetical protein